MQDVAADVDCTVYSLNVLCSLLFAIFTSRLFFSFNKRLMVLSISRAGSIKSKLSERRIQLLKSGPKDLTSEEISGRWIYCVDGGFAVFDFLQSFS